jgi:hypothetical protein
VLSALLAGSSACSSKVACADLGADWTSCPAPHGDICVLKGKEGACDQISGTGSSSSSTSSSASSSSGSSGCPSSFETMCPSGCVLLNSDDQNCGKCGLACTSGQICFAGSCQ